MANGIQNVGTISTATSATLTDSIAVTVGDSIIVIGQSIRLFVAGDCADSAGNTYVLDNSNTSAGAHGVGIWRCQSAVSTATVTVTLSNLSVAAPSDMSLLTVRGLNATPLDVTAIANGLSTSASTGTTSSTAQAKELVIAALGGAASTITTPAGGGSGTYTNFGSAAAINHLFSADYLVTIAAGTQAGTWTIPTGSWRGCIACWLIDPDPFILLTRTQMQQLLAT